MKRALPIVSYMKRLAFVLSCIPSKYMSLKNMRVRGSLPRVLDLMIKSILTIILLEPSHSMTHSVESP